MKSLLTSYLIFVVIFSQGQILKAGMWTGQIAYDSIQVPITFEIVSMGGEVPEIIFINGQERITIKNAEISGDSLFIPIDPFDVSIQAQFGAMSITGEYVKNYRDDRMLFTARYGGVRFLKKSTKQNVRIEDRWKMTFSPNTPNMSDGVGLFKQMGDRVTGTVISETSDYRYFDGILDDDSIKLSSFDGAHAFMILGKRNGLNEWEGRIIFDNNYEELWTAVYDAEAELTDPFELVKIEQDTHKPYYDLLGAGTGANAIDPLEYEGKVLIIQVFGTWCPNSLDQTKYLVGWYNKNKDRDVSILASSYEANYSKEYGSKRLEDYKRLNKIPYDMVLGGRLSKTGAAMPFPFINKIKAFPTLVIVDKNGYARYVHSYFNGPATGSYYKEFDVRFNEIMDELLAE